MKRLFILLFLALSTTAFAQQELAIQSSDKGFYILHTVIPKESLYSLSRLFKLAPRDLAAFNGLDITTGLEIGQALKVPLTPANFTQKATGTVPVIYTVGEREGLYRVSVKNNNVLMASLRKWNNLTSDAIQTGQKLIVGYVNTAGPLPVTPTETAPVTTQPQPQPVAVSETPKQKNPEPPIVTKPQEFEKTVVSPDVAKPVEQAPVRTAVKDGAGGYFKTAFEQQSRSSSAGKEHTATAGIFKTASGWQDTKYYALMDGVDPGTIVRVVNPTNSKAVYAKVLGGMSGIRQNAGLDVRISNAAANVLDISDTEKFVVHVNY